MGEYPWFSKGVIMRKSKVYFGDMYVRLLTTCLDVCRHCYADAGPNVEIMLPKKKVFRVIDIWKGHRRVLQKLVLDGGDALLYPYLEEIVKYAHKGKVWIESYLRTSGLLFESDFDDAVSKVKRLNELGLTGMTVCPGDYHAVKDETISQMFSVFSDIPLDLRTIKETDMGKAYAIKRALMELKRDEIYLGNEKRCHCMGRLNDVPLIVLETGDLAYCVFGAGTYANISMETEEIEQIIQEDPIRKLLELDKEGLAKLIDIALELDPEVLNVDSSDNSELDELPKNCAACYRILTEKGLIDDDYVRGEAKRRFKKSIL